MSESHDMSASGSEQWQIRGRVEGGFGKSSYVWNQHLLIRESCAVYTVYLESET